MPAPDKAIKIEPNGIAYLLDPKAVPAGVTNVRWTVVPPAGAFFVYCSVMGLAPNGFATTAEIWTSLRRVYADNGEIATETSDTGDTGVNLAATPMVFDGKMTVQVRASSVGDASYLQGSLILIPAATSFTVVEAQAVP